MNNPIIDAIGSLDDTILYEAKYGKTNRRTAYSRAFALAAAILILLAVGGGLFILHRIQIDNTIARHEQTPGKYTITEFSFKKKKLKALCDCDVSYVPVYKDTDPGINTELFDNIGSGINGVVYADAQKVVFTTGKGVFVYDYQNEQLLLSFDIFLFDVPGFNQGDAASTLEVDSHGKYAVLTSCENWSDPESVCEYRLLDLTDGSVTQVDETQIPESFSPVMHESWHYYPKSDSGSDKDLPNSWPSSLMSSYTDDDGKLIGFYTNIERDPDGKVIVGKMDLVIVQPDRSYTTQRVFAGLFPEFAK